MSEGRMPHTTHPVPGNAADKIARLEAENAQLRAERDRWKGHADSYLADVLELRTVLERIANMEVGAPPIDYACDMQAMARRALEGTNDRARVEP